MATTRWGILAPGRIAHSFAKGLAGLDDAKIVAVGSRSVERAAEFASQYGNPRAYGSYEELAADPEVDAIYVANPHPYHKDATILCLNHNKPVLCEKPFAVNVAETDAMIESARANDTFLMEAMWTRFMPHMQQIRAWIDAGRIGDIRMINASFGFRSPWNPEGRLLNPELAGGALLDVGIYVVSAAYWVTGKDPIRIVSQAHVGETGVDEQSAYLFTYDDGAIASLSSAVQTQTRHTLSIYGTDGWIDVPHPFFMSTRAVLHVGEEEIVFEQPHISNGYEYQAIEVAKCLAEGKRESSILPLAESRRIMVTLDTIREQIGVSYPFE